MSVGRGIVTGLPLVELKENAYAEIAEYLDEEWHRFLQVNQIDASSKNTIGMHGFSSLDDNNNRKKHLIIAFSGSQFGSLEERTKIAKRVESHISKFLKDLKQYNPEKWQSWEKAVGEIEIVTEVNVSPEGTAHQYGYNKIRCINPEALSLLDRDTLPKSVKNFNQGQIIVCQGQVYLVSNQFILLQPQPDKTVIENFCHKDTVENRKALGNEVDRIVSNHNEEIGNKHFPSLTYLHNEFIDLSKFNNDIKNWDMERELKTQWPVKNGTVVITTNPKNIYIKNYGSYKQLDIVSKDELEDIKNPKQQGLLTRLSEKISSYNVNLKKNKWPILRYKCCDPKLAAEREKKMRSERGYLDEVEIYYGAILKGKNNVLVRIGDCQECQARAIDFRMLPMTTVSLKDEKNQTIELTRPPSPVGTTKILEGNHHLPFQTSVDWFVTEANFQMKTANSIKIEEDKKNESFESLTKQRQKELCHERAIFYLNHAISAILEKKLLTYEDFFKLDQLYELRATQKKILGFHNVLFSKDITTPIENPDRTINLSAQQEENKKLESQSTPLMAPYPTKINQKTEIQKKSLTLHQSPSSSSQIFINPNPQESGKKIKQQQKRLSTPSNRFDLLKNETEDQPQKKTKYKKFHHFQEVKQVEKSRLKKSEVKVEIEKVIIDFFDTYEKQYKGKISNLNRIKQDCIAYYRDQYIEYVYKNKVIDIQTSIQLSLREKASWFRFSCCKKTLILDKTSLAQNLHKEIFDM